MLVGKWWLTDAGSVQMDASEHAVFSLRYMLAIPIDRHIPMSWTMRGVPDQELVDALARGADKQAVEFLSKKGNDSRLYALKTMGWIRTAKSAWNCWIWDKKTVAMARNANDYWSAQYLTGNEMVDVGEFSSRDTFSISVKALLDGGDAAVLKNRAMGRPVDLPEEPTAPVYSASKFSELERDRLYARSGANPRRRSR